MTKVTPNTLLPYNHVRATARVCGLSYAARQSQKSVTPGPPGFAALFAARYALRVGSEMRMKDILKLPGTCCRRACTSPPDTEERLG